jgi:hypothetical protein
MPTFNIDSPIVIKVTGKKVTQSDAQKKRKVTFRKSKANIFRRKKLTGLITFFDLGYKLNNISHEYETYVDQIIPPFIPEVGTSFVDVRNLGISEVTSLQNLILSEDVTTFETKFFQIKKSYLSDNYNLAVSRDEDDYLDLRDVTEFSDDGLKVTDDELSFGVKVAGGITPNLPLDFPDVTEFLLPFFAANRQFVNQDLILKTHENQKITTVADYTAPEVGFSPDKFMTVFLMPAYALSNGESIYSTPDIHQGFLNLFYQLIPREWVLNESNLHYNKVAGSVLYPFQESTVNYNRMLDIVHSHESLANSRGTDSVVDGSGTVASFIYQPTNAVGNPQQNDLRCKFDYRPVDNEGQPNGILKAIVKKQDQYFYFWTSGF